MVTHEPRQDKDKGDSTITTQCSLKMMRVTAEPTCMQG